MLELGQILELYSVQRRTGLEAQDLGSLCFIRYYVVEHLLCRREKKEAEAKKKKGFGGNQAGACAQPCSCKGKRYISYSGICVCIVFLY